jgi:hypothetical protein
MVLRTFLAPPAPDVELGTVSFKSKMDEVIKNFCQYWPIHDLPFELASDSPPKDDKKTEAPVKEVEKEIEKPPPENNNGSGGDHNGTDFVDRGASAVAASAPFTSYDMSSMLFNIAHTMASAAATTSDYVPDPKQSNNDVSKTDNKQNPGATSQSTKTDDVSAEQDSRKVDLLIYLPQDHFESRWLPEWSRVDLQDVPTEKETAT